MIDFSGAYVKAARYLLPTPFTIAILLSLLVLGLCIFVGENSLTESLSFWEKGLWKGNNFAFHCMYMLVIGHVIALSKPFEWLTDKLLAFIKNGATAAFFVTLLAVITGLINWGLGLIIGAIFARKVGEHCKRKKIKASYPILGAAGYAGLMVWHGGLSGSAPLTISKNGHDLYDLMGVISTHKTLFSNLNLAATFLCLLLLPTLMYFVARVNSRKSIEIARATALKSNSSEKDILGIERLDASKWFSRVIGFGLLLYALYRLIDLSLNLNLAIINLTLFAVALLLHQNVNKMLQALDQAIVGASGILLQFPLYFGIMGMMNGGDLAKDLSDFFVSISSKSSLPIYTFFSAGILNIFVPSGGGQWAVQGPIIIDACKSLMVPLEKGIMAMCYGDQLTNMLQPFWALPLLGITGLKAKDILPYTLILMFGGLTIFISVLMIF